MKVGELRAELARRGLATGGVKKDLVQRLNAALGKKAKRASKERGEEVSGGRGAAKRSKKEKKKKTTMKKSVTFVGGDKGGSGRESDGEDGAGAAAASRMAKTTKAVAFSKFMVPQKRVYSAVHPGAAGADRLLPLATAVPPANIAKTLLYAQAESHEQQLKKDLEHLHKRFKPPRRVVKTQSAATTARRKKLAPVAAAGSKPRGSARTFPGSNIPPGTVVSPRTDLYEAIADGSLPLVRKVVSAAAATAATGNADCREVYTLSNKGGGLEKIECVTITSLHLAILSMEPGIARFLASETQCAKDLCTPIQPSGQTPLLTACDGGDTPTLKLVMDLLDTHVGEDLKTAQLRLANTEGIFPLLAVVLSGELSAVRLLCGQGKLAVAELRRSCPAGRTALLVAVRQGNLQMVRFLIAREKQLAGKSISMDPSSVNKASLNGMTPFAWSAMGGNLQILRLLYANGGAKDLMTPNDAGHTPMQVAVAGGHTRIVRQLVQWGIPEMDSNLARLSLFSSAAAIGDNSA